jgi:hypothetical protein
MNKSRDIGSLRVNNELGDLYCSKTGLTVNEYFDMLDDWDSISSRMEMFECLLLRNFRNINMLDNMYARICDQMKVFEDTYKIKCYSSIHYSIKSYEPLIENI